MGNPGSNQCDHLSKVDDNNDGLVGLTLAWTLLLE